MTILSCASAQKKRKAVLNSTFILHALITFFKEQVYILVLLGCFGTNNNSEIRSQVNPVNNFESNLVQYSDVLMKPSDQR